MTPSEKPPTSARLNELLATRLADRGFALAYIAEVDADMMRQAAQVAEAVAAMEQAKVALADCAHSLTYRDELEWGHGSIELANAALAQLDAAISMLRQEGKK